MVGDDATNRALIDRCSIYHEPDEVLHEFKRSMPNWPSLVGYLIVAGAQPEKISIDIVWKAALEFNSLKPKYSYSEFVDNFGLREMDLGEIKSLLLEESIELDARFFRKLKGNERVLYEMPPRLFETIVAEILKDMGCQVELTPPSRDGGRDILAAFNTPLGEILTIVECKRYKPERKIGIDLFERFLWIIDRKDRASFGLIATTSFFSSDAQALAQRYRYRLKLKDFDGLKEWVAQYGSWAKGDSSGIWIPGWWSTITPKNTL